MKFLNFQLKKISKNDISDLHNSLASINYSINDNEKNNKNIGNSTTEAISDIQRKNKIPATGNLSDETIKVINYELFDVYQTSSKTRTERLHMLLEKVGEKVDDREKSSRITGETTREKIKAFQKSIGMADSGKVTEELIERLQEEAVRKAFSTKTQIGRLQKTILKAARIAKLSVEIDLAELKEKTVGSSTSNAIKAIQAKYNLPQTGEINKTTLDRIQSIAVSRGAARVLLHAPQAHTLSTIRTKLRLNMSDPQVNEAQKALAHLGYRIDEHEFKDRVFGKTTREAVLQFQKRNALPETGHIEGETLKTLNLQICSANPKAEDKQLKYRIRGSVRDELMEPKGRMVIQVYEKLLDGDSKAPLAAKKNHLGGFFDIAYTPPVDTKTGKVKDKFHLAVKLLDEKDKLIGYKTIYNALGIQWVNFNLAGTSYNGDSDSSELINFDFEGIPYKGDSEYQSISKILKRCLSGINAADVKETADNRQITQISRETGLTGDDIMRIILSHRVSGSIGGKALTPEAIFAFIRQNVPSNFPGDLLRETSDWAAIDQLVEKVENGVVFSEDNLLEQTLENAINKNIVSLRIKQKKSDILGELREKRIEFTLSKPILTGNGKLGMLLDKSSVKSQYYNTVAEIFAGNQGVNDEFWTELNKHKDDIGENSINDLKITIDLGNVSKNHVPTIEHLKSFVGTGKNLNLPGGITSIKRTSDIGKFNHEDWVAIIKENNGAVPDNLPDGSTEEKIWIYADILLKRAEAMFPAVSLTAAVKRSGGHKLKRLDKVEKFIDENPDFGFRLQNLDKYLIDNPGAINAPEDDIKKEIKEEIKVIQRIHKLSPDTLTGKAMAEEGLHCSSQIYFAGRDRIVKVMKKHGVEEKNAVKLYEQSKMRYSQVLARILDYRRDIHVGTPQVIINPTYTKEEIEEYLGDIPNLEVLFGSQDYCECEHCQSLYGPPAYLADIFRFLKRHDSLVERNGRTLTVQEILFERRPDLGNIKLNCDNTETPMPYIDLVCEILENNIPPQKKDFSYQTESDQKQLRAMPQNIREEAYDTLAEADYPIYSSFDLWQQEARMNLNYLKVPRFELIKAFRNGSSPGNQAVNAAAAEYFGISSHEAEIICTEMASRADQDKYWGIDTSVKTVSADEFLKRTKLNYNQLLQLLMVKFVNPEGASHSEINRPLDSCSLKAQEITNLSLNKFDGINRFIRLWRKTGWEMWELDLILRSNKTGETLKYIKNFRELQKRLSLPVEVLLTFYGDINTEYREKPEKPAVKIPPLYFQLFRNKAGGHSTDDNFEITDERNMKLKGEGLPLEVTGGYSPVAQILSALALKQSDFDLLKEKTDKKLSLKTLSALTRYAFLARSLKISIKDLLTLLNVTNVSEPFTSPEATGELVKSLETIKASGFSLMEIDYILRYNPDSPLGLRKETLKQYIKGLRSILISNEDTFTKLALDDERIQGILAFDADSLTDGMIVDELKPLRDILEQASLNVEEVEYIKKYEETASFAKADLIGKIKKIQKDLQDMFNQNSNQIAAYFGSSFSLSDEQSKFILNSLAVPDEKKKLIEVLSDKTLTEKDPGGGYREITPEGEFRVHFRVYALVHKISLLLQRMKIDFKGLVYFQTNNKKLVIPDLETLPIEESDDPVPFTLWKNLHSFIDFQSKYPEPEDSSLYMILDKAMDRTSTADDIYGLLNKLTQWNPKDLTELGKAMNLKKGDYLAADTYTRLNECFGQMKLTGASTETMLRWAKWEEQTIQKETAKETRLAIKSKYENEDWLEKIRPLQDDLREKKRTALVEYLLEESQRNRVEDINKEKICWNDSNEMYKYFLIDVEMGAVQLTSRIKQAISSVQFFVQRCFLNLENRYVQVSRDEKEDTSSENAWSQWKWMKNYRIWEANRKVFFYPENWIEPELRDDKSSFFEELENEIMQNEITDENVEAAFINYLHKVDEVSHLEICGLYHEMEDLNLHELGYEINNVHVIARTKDIPAIYYYRKYDMNYSAWTPWEKIDLDIKGDQVVPVVYNRKLHLFWLIFVEKPQKSHKVPPAKPSEGPSDAPEAPKVLEVQLAWSIKREKGWTPKKISSRKLIHPWERPYFSYNLKPYYHKVTNELWMDIYLSTSEEFNNGKFYDPFYNRKVCLTGNRFNETYLPWHSASFIFDGDVKDIKLKGLNGLYHYQFHIDFLGIDIDIPYPGNSYDYVANNFGEEGRKLSRFRSDEDGPRLGLPAGMHFHNTHLTNNRHDEINNADLRVLENEKTASLLKNALNPFELVITQQDLQFDTMKTDHPFFYQDRQRAFFIQPEWQKILNVYGCTENTKGKYRVLPFYHPYTVLFIRELNRSGLEGLLNRKIQTRPQKFFPENTFSFGSYAPESNISPDAWIEKGTNNFRTGDIVDFSFGGAYSIYNWELFFHAPMMIASKLSQNQRFEEAMKWYHYIFDPTNIEVLPSPNRYWVTKPFYEYNSDDMRKQRIESILSNLDLKENDDQLKAMRNNPFKPHLIARYRPVAYQRNVVMKYLDNLIAWADQLFRRDTIESINEAALLYILAYDILGRRPVKVPDVKRIDMSFNDIEGEIDEFGNFRADVLVEDTLVPVDIVPSTDGTQPLPSMDIFYFGIPNNENILKYWDTVEDRLFKIRHSMNIEGVVRQLPLFEPPIDPALLVKAAAAGIDLNSVLNDISFGMPHYRFRIILQKAIEFCNDVRALGEKLLGTLEKKDAEELSLLRSEHEINMLKAIKDIKKKQIDESVKTLESLEKAKEAAEEKKIYYSNRVSEGLNILESLGLSLNNITIGYDDKLASNAKTEEMLRAFIPDMSIGVNGFGGSPSFTFSVGGSLILGPMQYSDAALSHTSSALQKGANQANTRASYVRRNDEWAFQERLADIEIDQLQCQINAAQIRQAIAEKELDNQELQIEQAMTVDEYMKNKYTNKQLYSWMITQISTVYFQAYQLAFDMARKAEKCYQYELGISNSGYIQFGYWDSLKKGLQSGDNLLHSLRKLEAAYLEQNKRELEITKHISLAQFAPQSLMSLKETGQCQVTLPEWLFNMDYPGHYMRRIKSVSVSVPCIIGPYTNVNCTLSLLSDVTRTDSSLKEGQYGRIDGEDDRFRYHFSSLSSIATSSGQNDSGMFEINFNDERYLPFEGAGAISEWKIVMPKENNYFDFSSMSDFIINIQYTARDGGAEFANKAYAELEDALPQNSMRLFSLKQEYPNEWHKFLNPAAGTEQELEIDIKPEHYPFFLRGMVNILKFNKIQLFAESRNKDENEFEVKLQMTSLEYEASYSDTMSRDYSQESPKPAALGKVKMKLRIKGVSKPVTYDDINDILLLCFLTKE